MLIIRQRILMIILTREKIINLLRNVFVFGIDRMKSRSFIIESPPLMNNRTDVIDFLFASGQSPPIKKCILVTEIILIRIEKLT